MCAATIMIVIDKNSQFDHSVFVLTHVIAALTTGEHKAIITPLFKWLFLGGGKVLASIVSHLWCTIDCGR